MQEKTPYQVLSRRWRPKVFEEIVGQEHVTTCLMNAIEANRVGHAYLFSGSRGVGKTTAARIFARAINCENGPKRNPCNQCNTCREMLVGSSLDFLEIDGASNRGIDEVREIREKIKYATAGSRYRIYVIDEVHMLTTQAFNALLKTLEEPPSHVIFIMATTAPSEIPATILSRCQRFDFRRIFPEKIVERLKMVSKEERFSVEDEALAVIAKKAEGSMRDAESMLDQLVTGTEGTLTAEVVRNFLGIPKEDVFFEITQSILDGKPASTLKVLEELYKEGHDLEEFASSLIDHLRHLLLVSIDKSLAEPAGILKSSLSRLVEQSAGTNDADLVRLIRILNSAAYFMKKSPVPRLHLELALVEMANLDSTVSIKELIERLSTVEGRFAGDSGDELNRESGAGKKHVIQDDRESPASHDSDTRSQSHIPASSQAEPGDTKDAAKKLENILLAIKKKKTSLWGFLSEAKVLSISETELTVELPRDQKFHRERIEDKVNREIILDEIKKAFGKPLSLKVVDGEVTEIEGAKAYDPMENETVKTIVELFHGEIVKKEKG